jgi:predicted metal-dependent phosphotriesterase family hydrolase
VAPGHIVLSHLDKVVDRGYHRELLGSGAFGEYDQSFRWGDKPNGTLQVLAWAVEDGLDGQVLLGMDAARRTYYRVNGGSPGLTWLLAGFTDAMAERGLAETIRHRLFVDNPARAFAFATTGTEGGT